ncbi:MAG: bifunctional isocitrate dehydrogenase kinase/phosphatase [Gammaproteobacteria bacterium]|nr:bifunctional isocitrate dehydrogenase kinase/phosphatase [Gammaproteobacteria bacterium]
MTEPNPDREIVAVCAKAIYEEFLRYNSAFSRTTNRARRRFEQRDWQGHQKDIAERVDLYEKSVQRLVVSLRKVLDDRVNDHALWPEIRWFFGERLAKVPDAGFVKTYFNSTTRRIFGTVGIDPEVEFVAPPFEDELELIQSLNLQRYPYWASVDEVFTQVLSDFAFKVSYADVEHDIDFIAREVEQFIRINLDGLQELIRFEFINSVFYQSARAYLVGRIVLNNNISPIVIALKNTDKGICVDAVLQYEDEVSIVFSYTRSYYFADPNSVVAAVHFLHTILPRKPIDELYTVLGRLRQGKTERYRIFNHHLLNTDDQFVHADGDKGLVMIVFTLPSYDLVFKIIRDKFGYPKTIKRQDVLDKYRLVSKHDRAGRLIDTQEFRKLEFPLDRFAPALLDELFSEATETVTVEGEKLIINHVYIERRVRPLNLYLREAHREAAKRAILDYGQTIHDLANTDIFPGDLLLKNFGVTRHERVVFYDYDEVALVTECNFREIPQPRDDDDTMRSESWYHVNPLDIFPEEFIKFLAMDAELRELFMQVHGELLTARFWREMKEKHLQGEISLVIPYYRPSVPDKQYHST